MRGRLVRGDEIYLGAKPYRERQWSIIERNEQFQHPLFITDSKHQMMYVKKSV